MMFLSSLFWVVKAVRPYSVRLRLIMIVEWPNPYLLIYYCLPKYLPRTEQICSGCCFAAKCVRVEMKTREAV
jgi:hypothetical protein